MRDDRIVRAYEQVKPSPSAKREMLDRILAAQEEPSRPISRINAMFYRRVLPAACAVAVLLCVFALPERSAPGSSPVVIQQTAPGADSPNGMRKMMNFDGFRYAFLENGAAYDLESDRLSQPLGTLDYDIQTDPQVYGSAEYAASFAVGGTVYEIDGYDPAFRLAVEWEGQYYIAQCVDTLDDSTLDLGSYFDTAGFQDTVDRIEICDHAGRTVLREVDEAGISPLLTLLAQAVQAELTDEEYQEIARAQRSGGSYQLVFRLVDGTSYSLHVIPALSIVSAGDNRYRMPEEYQQELSEVFNGLHQVPLPMG